MKKLLLNALLGLLVFAVPAIGQDAAKDTEQSQTDKVNQEASRLEGELGKYKDTDAVAGDVMVQLCDLYHQNGRVFGLVRVAQRFVSAHPTDKRHAEVMLKLIDGLEATSRNEDMTAASRQFISRYPNAPQVPNIEIRLAKTLDQLKDRRASAEAHHAVAMRQPKTNVGREHAAVAIQQYQRLSGKADYTKAAELADHLMTQLPVGTYLAEIAWQGFYQWRRGSEWAKSNLTGSEILKKKLPLDKDRLRQLHYYMGENYQNQGQWSNAVASYRAAHQLSDAADIHMRLIYAMYQNAASKPAEMAPIVASYVKKFPERDDRFTAQSYLAWVNLRSENASEKANGLKMVKALLPNAARTNSNASQWVRQSATDEKTYPGIEQGLAAAISQAKTPYNASYLRYVLAFEVQRDRMKNPAKTRQTLLDLVTKSATDDSYSQNAVSWLLSKAETDQQFQADLKTLLKARQDYVHLASYRNMIGAWAKSAKRDKNLKARAEIARAAVEKQNALPLFKDWYTADSSRNSRDAAEARERLLAPSTFNKLSDDAARKVLNAQAYYYRHYSPGNERSRTTSTYAKMVKRFPQDERAAMDYLHAATDYGPAELSREAALHLMKFDPPSAYYDLLRRLMLAADQNKDASLAKQSLAWIQKAEQKHGMQLGYAYAIGDVLTKYELKAEAEAYWKAHLALDYGHLDARHCAERILRTMADEKNEAGEKVKDRAPERIAFLQNLLKTPTDYHGTYAMWLANEYYLAKDLAKFEQTLRNSLEVQRERPFRTWGMEEYPPQYWVDQYRANKEATPEQKLQVFAVVRDLEISRSSAAATLAHLELEPIDQSPAIKHLIAYQTATCMVGDASHDWDRVRPYVDAALNREEYLVAATLLSGMLENIPSADANRKKTGRQMVAQSYSRMGAVGLTIDSESEIAPLLQAALYLRLGDRRIAYDTYLQNQKLFNDHREEVPVDLLLFICESHMAAGGDENYDRVEDILRAWIIKHSESKQYNDKTKAKVQLLLARNFAKAQRYDVARSEFTTVLNRYPETPQALEAEFGIGETLMEQKVFDQAEIVFEKLAGSRDANVVVRAEFLRGVLAHRRGDRDEAREIFQSVLERVPDIDLANRALFNLAEVFGDEERYIDQLNLLRTVGRLGRRSKRWHGPGQALSIVVQDSDLGISRGRSEIRVIVTTQPGGDVEEVKLTSGGAGKGLFRADLDTRLGEVTKRDGVLQLSGNDIIKSDYPDDFKQEFRRVPLSDVEIRIASDGEFDISSSLIVDQEEQSFTSQLQNESNEDNEDQRVSQFRPANQIKPGNTIYLRVKDGDRDLSAKSDEVIVKLAAESGDQVQVKLTETGAHTGVFEGTAQTGELPAGALASDTAIQHSPLMAIDQDKTTSWLSEPDGATPKTLTIDMKDLKRVSRIRVSTPDAERRAFVRGKLLGSNDGRFWFPIASHPPLPDAAPIAEEYGQLTERVFYGNRPYRLTTWDQVVNLAKNGQPDEESQVNDLEHNLAPDTENAKGGFGVVWFGKMVQPRAGAVRIAVNGYTTALAVDGTLHLDVARGNRTADIWLDQGTHDLTIFASTSNVNQTVSARMARANHNAEQVNLIPFQKDDFDLNSPLARPAIERKPTQAEISETEWNFTFDPHDLRFTRFVIEEYLGEAVAVNHFEIGGSEPGLFYIPTQADVLSLANNNVLEIAGGDVVEATYTDEFTQLQSGASRLLTRELTATYYNAVVSSIAYDFVRQNNGAVSTIRKELMRIDPGERITIEIVDYDRDQTNKPDKVQFEVIVNDGDPIPMEATENDDYSGIFTKEIDTTAGKEDGKLTVKQGDRVYLRYLDMQNTFPGHAVPREAEVHVNQPTNGLVRILETRSLPGDPEKNTPDRIVYLPYDETLETSKVAFEAPLTVVVIDPDAAKDDRSKVTVHFQTTDGATVAVECEISSAYSQNAAPAGVRNWALAQGRFVGQVIMQLGSKNSSTLVPVTIDMPRNLLGEPIDPNSDDAEASALDRNLVTRVMNLSGKDLVTATYADKLRSTGKPTNLTSSARLVTNGTLACTDRDYNKPVERVHVGEKLFLLVTDADQDRTDERDTVTIEITSEFGEKEIVTLAETLAHSGTFTGSLTLKSNAEPKAGNFDAMEPVIECYFGDTLHVKYTDPSAGSETGERTMVQDLPVVIGTDGLVTAFSKTFNDEKLAVETKFHIAESYFELFKSHKTLGRSDEEKADLESGRRILREVMEDYPNPKYAPRVAYLLGQFAQELEQWDEAIDSYQLIIRRYPEHALAPDAQYKLAQSYEEAGDFDQALEAYVTLAATYPRSPLIASVMIRICDHFYKKENFKVAAQVGEKFLEKFDTHKYASRIAFRIGQCFYKGENFNDAGAAFDRFAKRFPDDALCSDALFWSGESFRMARNNRMAFQRYNRCRWDFPASDAAKYARGRLALPEMLQQFEAEVNSLDNNN